MSREKEQGKLAKLLVERRRALQATSDRTREELDALKAQDPDPEYQEKAQSDLAEHTLAHVIEGQHREMLLIDGALRRMDEGVYGECVDCGAAISVERLSAVPFTLRCEEDAEAKEQHRPGGPVAHSTL